MALTPGSRLGSYEVTALIGQGGMGEVYQGNSTVRGLAEPQSAFLIAQPGTYGPIPENATVQGAFLAMSVVCFIAFVLAVISKMFNVHLLTTKPEDKSWISSALWLPALFGVAFGFVYFSWDYWTSVF